MRAPRLLSLFATSAFLAACWTARDTGPRSMIGVLTGPDGEPLRGVSVETVEARDVTDDQGQFGVHYKEPAQHVFFDHEGLRWQRVYLGSDEGSVVAIQTRPVTRRALHCDTPDPCQAVLHWDLGGGLTASVTRDCEPGEPVMVPMLAGLPDEATCRPDTTSPAAPHAVRSYEALDVLGEFLEGVEVHPPPVRVTLRLSSPDRPMPERCDVFLDGVPAKPVDQGLYEATVWGHVSAWAVCDGILGVPFAWIVHKPSELPLTWRRDTPVLDLRAHRPDVKRVTLAQRSGRGHGWLVELPLRSDGTWQLPPLVPGEYKIGLDAPDRVVRLKPSRPDMPKDRVFVEEARWGEVRGDGSTYGMFDLDAPIATGPLPVSWATEEYEFRDDVAAGDRPR